MTSYLLAYLAVAVFCWGWWFAYSSYYNIRHYWAQAIITLGLASLWIFTIWGFAAHRLEMDDVGIWHGWRLPYIERLLKHTRGER